MPEKQKQIMETLEKAISGMTDAQQDRLLGFGEGISFMNDLQKRQEKKEEVPV